MKKSNLIHRKIIFIEVFVGGNFETLFTAVRASS